MHRSGDSGYTARKDPASGIPGVWCPRSRRRPGCGRGDPTHLRKRPNTPCANALRRRFALVAHSLGLRLTWPAQLMWHERWRKAAAWTLCVLTCGASRSELLCAHWLRSLMFLSVAPRGAGRREARCGRAKSGESGCSTCIPSSLIPALPDSCTQELRSVRASCIHLRIDHMNAFAPSIASL